MIEDQDFPFAGTVAGIVTDLANADGAAGRVAAHAGGLVGSFFLMFSSTYWIDATEAGADIIELGQLTTGQREGRRSEEQITICDLTGTGAQDTAIAVLSLKKAQKWRLGRAIDMG